MSRRHDRREGERGQGLIELALVAPILILIIAAVVQFGIIFERQIGITNAIREAARRAATIDVTNANVGSTALWTYNLLNSTTNLLGAVQTHDPALDSITVCIVQPASPNDVDVSGKNQAVVRITDTYKHPLFMPIVNVILDTIDGTNDNMLSATASVEFHIEQSATTPDALGSGAGTTDGTTTSATCTR